MMDFSEIGRVLSEIPMNSFNQNWLTELSWSPPATKLVGGIYEAVSPAEHLLIDELLS